MTHNCPMCGSELSHESLWPASTQVQRGAAQAIVEFLAANAVAQTTNQLIDYLWGDEYEGGPLMARKQIHVIIARIRRDLRRRGEYEVVTTGWPARYLLRRCKP